MPEVDLVILTRGEVRSLIGHERGVAARQEFDLDRLDKVDEEIVVRVPGDMRTLTPSFLQGLFAGSVSNLGEHGFYKHYKFDAPMHILDDVRAGVDRILTSRHLAGEQ
ncbi:hypothetical protein [Pseudolabrys sp. FHR47]|uniref:hypothetical protein n=1 Tax=Pseudolabrys sp. FHR47 TaxID=2562284 RepID=UPI0010BE6CC9|nr:hypothetical protein [Pseudolabrys sp. FHR47]